jgi:hypothetical protein
MYCAYAAIYHFFVITVCHLNINFLNRVVSLYCPPIIVKKNSSMLTELCNKVGRRAKVHVRGASAETLIQRFGRHASCHESSTNRDVIAFHEGGDEGG